MTAAEREFKIQNAKCKIVVSASRMMKNIAEGDTIILNF